MVRGVVASFDAERGFGFIRTRSLAEDVFVHIRDVEGGRALRPGQRVRFEVEPGERGPRAVRVEPGRAGVSPAWDAALALGAALAVSMLTAHRLGLPWIWAWVAAVNPVTLAVYAWDKHRARRGERRTPEWVLLALAFVGGSPAAALGMSLLRHKTSKASFRLAFGGVVAAQVALLAVWFRPR